MLRQFITTIDYAKLIEMQANSCKTKVEKQESKSFKACSKSKKKNYKMCNSVNRHH